MTPLPLLDCVADMEVIYGLDTDGNPATASSGTTTFPALRRMRSAPS